MDPHRYTPPHPHDLHLAIIMDGNGRWAKKRNLPRIEGHKKGADVAKNIVKPISSLGVTHLTLFAFSTENWKRTDDEVQALMAIFHDSLSQFLQEHQDHALRFRVIGNRKKLNPSLQTLIHDVEQVTKDNQGMHLHIALNYGGQHDIASTAKHLAHQVACKNISPDDIDEKLFHRQLHLHSAPPADIILRTGGEQRLSNFLLWQAAYSELFFIDTLWPDITIESIQSILQLYKKRERRYGNTA